MASAVVDEALQGIQSIEFLDGGFGRVPNYPLGVLQIGLGHMRTFLLFARKWHNDVQSKSDENTSSSTLMMGSFLDRLENSLIENGKNFLNFCVVQGNEISGDLVSRAVRLHKCIESFRKEIADFYITLSDYFLLQSGDQSLEFIDYLQVNMADIITYPYLFHKRPIEVESLREKIVFFKNFIRFAQLRGFEPRQLQFLVTYLKVMAVNAARLFYEWPLRPGAALEKWSDEFQRKFSEPLLKIEPIHPQIRETYVQVLMALKFSESSQALTLGTDRHVLGDFVDSLLDNILEALMYRECYIASLKDQLPMLYEGLIFLRSILTNHFEKIEQLHEKVKNLIGTAVNDAAIIIGSFLVWEESLAKEMDFAFFNFLEKIKLIKIITSAIIFPRTSERGFVDFFLENLNELSSCNADSIAYAKDQIQTIQKELTSLRSSFLESDLDQRNQNGKLQCVWSRVAEVAYRTQFVIESLVVGDIPDYSTLEFNPITKEINLIKMEAVDVNQYSWETQNAIKNSSSSPSQGSTLTINKIVVTLDDEANTIIGEIIRGPEKRDIISLIGMPGIGKTTLARSVYDDPSVREHFLARAWCVISRVYEKKDLLLQILSSVDLDFSVDNYSKKNEYELEERLKKCLLRRRYLIVLDDVWDTDAWRALVSSFPNDANSSRILLTSRLFDVAKKINPDREPHRLRLLTVKESWHLLRRKLSSKKSYPLDLGKKIAKNCKGLPLTIVIIAGILANLEQDSWVEIAEKLSLSDLPIIDQCMDMLEVSYKTLPKNLRSCLLYFGAFREDEEIPCKQLIWLWKAEGFVQNCEAKSSEDVAKDYMNDLIGRNLIMLSKEKSIGGAKTCHVHDLLHEFCVIKAKKEKFLSVLSGYDELFTFHGQHDLQRLCIHSTSKDFEKSRLFCSSVRSLLFFADDGYGNPFKRYRIPFIFHLFKLLKVLNLTNINLGNTLPSEIGLLVELRYLAIYGLGLSIPPEVVNLSELETLLVYANQVFLPDTIWNLSKLRALQSNGEFCLNSDLMPTKLHDLDTFSIMYVSFGLLEKIMRKLPNIRRLKCKLFDESVEFNADCKSTVEMDWMTRLESLHLDLCGLKWDRIGFHFPLNIKKLSLSGCHWNIIPKVGKLPNLVVLKLRSIYFEGDTWDMNEEWDFPKLKLLEMYSLGLVRWTGSDDVDHFLCLEKLVVQFCKKLIEVPSCLENIQTLQRIEVRYCGDLVESLFRKIKEEQDNWGNDIQVLIENLMQDESSENAEDESSADAEDESSEMGRMNQLKRKRMN